jgi:3-deoxy-manno-octulosonate cytidylyltransferase (CMP-KDO synthetase)
MALLVIPARMASVRLPGKPLLAETGMPLVVHTWVQARLCQRATRVVVATDDVRIADAVRHHGGEAVMTSAACATGTDRVAEAARACPGPDLILNLQGDEPEIEPRDLDALLEAMEAEPDVSMGTLAAPLSPDDAVSPSTVKVVTSVRGDALYFSRAIIPFHRDGATGATAAAAPRRHVGVYAFRREFLDGFAALPPTPLERTEMLEQLRALEHGHRIRVVDVTSAPAGIDTPEDYAAFVARWRARNGGGSGNSGQGG